MANFVIYMRCSTQRQNNSLVVQKKAVERYLMNVEGANIVAEYSEKISGKCDSRIELSKAIADCQKYGATLIIAKLDRLSRNVSFIFALRDSGIDFLACDLPQFNTLTLAIFAAMAQQERELISSRTKAALAVLKAKGVKLGRPNAQFSDSDRAKASATNKRKAMSNLNIVKAVSMIKLLLQTTSSLTEIAKNLNDGGFVTTNNCKFTPCAVKRIIQRHALI